MADFTPITWVDNVTPLSASNLNRFEAGIGQKATLSSLAVLDVGVLNQNRAGRELFVSDFTTLLGLGTPVGLWDAGSLTNLGSGGALVNKGTVALTAKGINGTANHAAQFTGSTAQALYIVDTGSSDPFRIKTGSWGCWFRTAKRGAQQHALTKSAVSGAWAYTLSVNGSNTVEVYGSPDGATLYNPNGVTDVCDDRWHFVVATFDGSVLRVYVDGTLEASTAMAGTLFGSTAPLNIGGRAADGSTAATAPWYGRIAVPFVTPDVLNEDQIRFLYCAKVAHGLSSTPVYTHLAVRRKRKGGPYVTGDFTTTPKVLYNFTAGALTDAGSLGTTLTNNNAAVSVAGADGQATGAFQFAATSSQYLSGVSTGLPAGTSARSSMAWFKTLGTGLAHLVAIGGGTGTDFRFLYMQASGAISTYDGTTVLSSPGVYNDGQWHFAVVVIDNAATDGRKRKLYLDGKLVAEDASLASTTLGTGTLAIGRLATGSSAYWDGAIDVAAITDYAMAEDEVLSLYAKGSLALAASEKNPGDHIEGMDGTNAYVIFDQLESQNTVDLSFAA